MQKTLMQKTSTSIDNTNTQHNHMKRFFQNGKNPTIKNYSLHKQLHLPIRYAGVCVKAEVFNKSAIPKIYLSNGVKGKNPTI